MWLLPVLALVVLAAVACEAGDPLRSTGAYKIDVFQEMHYNQTFKAQEPPRFLPPEDSIPVTGGKLVLPESRSEAATLINPVAGNPTSFSRAALVYNINCSACHGQSAGGDGFVGRKFIDYGAPGPPAFSSERVQALRPGEAYYSITQGFGFMPAFGNLLSDEDRWTLVALIELNDAQRASLLTAPENQAPGG
jgi:mono/diheme cytochrome c family protein